MFIYNCFYEPTPQESDVFGALDIISPTMLALTDEALAGEKRGIDYTQNWELANQIMMLNLQLILVTKDRSLGMTLPQVEAKYKLTCAREHFACLGYDIDPLLGYYGINVAGLTGIDFMDLEDGGNIFKID